MKIKVIDLLNKIAKGEECKAKIKFKLGDVIIDFYGRDNYYNTPEYNIEYIDKGCTTHNINFGTLIKSLNDEIEIIEEPKEELEDIELIDIHYVNDKCIFKVYGQSIEETIAIKVNELIDEVNKLKKERIRNNELLHDRSRGNNVF